MNSPRVSVQTEDFDVSTEITRLSGPWGRATAPGMRLRFFLNSLTSLRPISWLFYKATCPDLPMRSTAAKL